MKIIIVDDEECALRTMEKAVREAVIDAEIQVFQHPQAALDYAKNNPIDVAFLDIQMCGISGLVVAKKLKDIHRKTNIIFATGYSEYAIDAFYMHVSSYLLKPVLPESIVECMENLRHPLPVSEKKGLRVRVFGNFEVFVDGIPMAFRYSKTKELFAYLIDRRGSTATIGELCAVLWEDRPASFSLKSQLRNLVSDLATQLAQAGASDVLIKRRGCYAIAIDKINCDYFGFLRQEIAAVNGYAGEYMAQYSWAEMTIGFLEKNK